MLQKKSGNLARDFLCLRGDFVITVARQRILLVDQERQIDDAQRGALRSRQFFEGTMYQDDGRNAFVVCCYSVAHGGASAGPSGADADDQVIAVGEGLAQLDTLRRAPGVLFVDTLNCDRLV